MFTPQLQRPQSERILSAYSYFAKSNEPVYLLFSQLLPPSELSMQTLSSSQIKKLHYVYSLADQEAENKGLIKIENVHCYYLIASHTSEQLELFATYFLDSVKRVVGNEWDLRGAIVPAQDFKAIVFPEVYQPLFFHFSLCLASRLCHKANPSTLLFSSQMPNTIHKTHRCKNIGNVNCYEKPIHTLQNRRWILMLVTALGGGGACYLFPQMAVSTLCVLLLLWTKCFTLWKNVLTFVVVFLISVFSGEGSVSALILILAVIAYKERERRHCTIEELKMQIGHIDITGYTSLAGRLSASQLRLKMERVYLNILKVMQEFEVLGFIGDAIFFRITSSDKFIEKARSISESGETKLKGGTGEGVVKRVWIGKNAPRCQYFGQAVSQAMIQNF